VYQVTVEANDGTDMDTHVVTVTVTDVDEAIVGDTLLDTYDGKPSRWSTRRPSSTPLPPTAGTGTISSPVT
jgi:hypothetical protein